MPELPLPAMTRAELRWLAALWCFHDQAAREYAAFRRALFERYSTPAFDRIQAAATRESPTLRVYREQAEADARERARP